jgi:hypothetical protein
MRSFGTCPNHHLAGTTDTGILINLGDLYADKRARYMESYSEKNVKFDRRRLFKINMKLLPWWKANNEDETAILNELKELKGLSEARAAMREMRRERRRQRKGARK